MDYLVLCVHQKSRAGHCIPRIAGRYHLGSRSLASELGLNLGTVPEADMFPMLTQNVW